MTQSTVSTEEQRDEADGGAPTSAPAPTAVAQPHPPSTPTASGNPTPATRLVILGKQGAGKGTQCELLVQRYQLAHISTGDILRAAVASGSELGRQAEAVMAAGDLVSDELILQIVAERLTQPDAQAGFLLDGFPRTPAQAEGLFELLGSQGLTAVIDLQVPDQVVLERMVGRGRADDTPEAIARRLALYEQQTAPLRATFAARTRLVTIDGLGSPEAVHQRICGALEGALAA